MPKNKKPAGGRPAKNFEPRTGAKAGRPSRPAAAKPGSKSPKHRGWKPEEPAAGKRRWDAAERAERATGRDDRAPRDDRGPRAERSERPAYGARDDRAPRRFDRDDRAPRQDRGDRPYRSAGSRDDGPSYGSREDRAPRRFDRDDRAPRQDRGDRPYRPVGDRDERPRYNRDDRAPRTERDERPRYNRDDRPAYGSRDDRAPRRFDRDDRAPRQDRDDRPRYDTDRRERAERSERAHRPHRTGYDHPARPARSDRFDRAERSASSFYPDKPKTDRFEPVEDVVLEKLEAVMTTASETVDSSFAELGLGDNICRQLASMGAERPFPIQVATIPDVLSKRDVLGRGKTGSGKTIAFGAPIVERLMENEGGKNRKMGRAPRALILAPTRELAMQIDRTVQPIARSVGLFTTTIYGGVPQARQVGALQRGVDIIIATPGRLEDLVQQRRIDLSNITITVLDEADHMCDLGFLEPVQRILRQTDPNGQRLLFSATLDKGVAAIVDEFLVDPAVHEVAGEDQASSTIDHRVLVIEHRDKLEVIRQLTERDGKTLVFSRTRAYAEQLADDLDDANIPATSLHGDLNQSRRTRNLQLLTSGRVDVLVATDVAARGIHIDDIDLVIQADAPDEYKTYLHRAGRTGRAGRHGVVVTLITKPRMRRTQDLLDRADIEAEMVMVRPGDELISQIARGEA
jgi:superfamily II DNA/RNA helicase